MRGRQVLRKYLLKSPYKGVVKSMRYKQPLYTARKLMKLPQLQRAILKEVLQVVNYECECLCKVVPQPSPLRLRSTNQLTHFSWQLLVDELREKAPVLTAILTSAARPTASKKEPSKNIITAAASILLKGRSKRMTTIPTLVAAILYAGHASKRVRCEIDSVATNIRVSSRKVG